MSPRFCECMSTTGESVYTHTTLQQQQKSNKSKQTISPPYAVVSREQ